MQRKYLMRAGYLAAVVGACAPHAARADSAASLLSQFNAIVFGGFNGASDVEGRTVIGGNLTGFGTFANQPLSGTSSYPTLSVYGNDTAGGSTQLDQPGGLAILGTNNTSYTMNAGGSIYVGGNNSGTLQTNSGNVSVGGTNSGTLSAGSGANVYVGAANSGSITVNNGTIGINGNDNAGGTTLGNNATMQVNGNVAANISGGSLALTGTFSGNPNGGAHVTHVTSVTIPPPSSPLPDFNATFKTPLTGLSSQLAALTGNSSLVPTASNAATITASPNSNGLAVFNLTSTQLASYSQISVALNGASSLIINVSIPGCVNGSNCSLDVTNNFSNPTAYANNVIWNFFDATSLTLGTQFGGTVLSPYATVDNANQIDGTLVAAAYAGSGELHSYAFSGTLPASSTTQDTPVPEPSSLALMLSGIAAAGWLRHRRKRV